MSASVIKENDAGFLFRPTIPDMLEKLSEFG